MAFCSFRAFRWIIVTRGLKFGYPPVVMNVATVDVSLLSHDGSLMSETRKIR
jgi:hypothetical protein